MADAEPPLPDGWSRVESRSRPGAFSYENAHTGKRVEQRPTVAARPAPKLRKPKRERPERPDGDGLPPGWTVQWSDSKRR